MSVEIVAVKLVGTYACGVPGTPDMRTLRSGWATDRCDCNNQLSQTNCGNLRVPMQQLPSPKPPTVATSNQIAPTDCSTNHASALDPAFFASCSASGGCLRVTVASRLTSLYIGNSTDGEQSTLGFIWCIDHTNGVVYARMNATQQPVSPPYLAAYFEIDDDAHAGRDCRFLATHWVSGNIARVYDPGLLNCSIEYTPSQLPGPDGVTNVTLRVD